MRIRIAVSSCIVTLGSLACSVAPMDASATDHQSLADTQDAPPGAATLLAPSGESANAKPTYEWQAVAGATSYWLFIADNSGKVFSQEGYDAGASCSAGVCKATPDWVLATGYVRWWILASNEAGRGPWSDPMEYRVSDTPVTQPPADCCSRPAFESGIYPQGARFPLVVLAFDPADAAAATASGWNTVHSYFAWTSTSVPVSFVQSSAAGGLLGLGSLDAPWAGDVRTSLPEDQAAGAITELSATGAIAWWDIPEELRYWKPTEMAAVQDYTRWTRTYDPKRSPNSMYIPGHYGTAAVQEYVPYLDIVPVSVYTTYYGKPHAWVRWRVESASHAIVNAGYTIGRDYLAGQKTPVAYLEIYNNSTGITPEGSYHDFWQAIVSGARGLLVYSYAYKDSSATLAACWQRLSDAARQLTGPENLEEAILYGTRPTGLSATVLSGPARTPSFEAPDEGTLDYAPIDVLALTYGGELFVIAVNSATEAVTARIAGSPSGAASADVLYEGGRTVSADSGAWQDDFEPLSVHIYRQSL